MKKTRNLILSVLCIFIVLTSTVGCDQKPALVFDEETHDFGEVEEGAKVSHTFTFRNNGSSPLEITDVRPTCGCTTSGEWTKEVEPGEKGEIPLTFNSTGYNGKVEKIINVASNDPAKPSITLRLAGSIKVNVEILPPRLWLGEVTADTKLLTGTFTLKNHLPEPVNILKIVPPGNKIKTKLEVIKEGSEYAISFEISAPFQEGSREESLLIMTDYQKRPQFSAKYGYYKPKKLEVSPDTIWVSKEDIKNPFFKTVLVLNRMDVLVSVSDIQVSDNTIQTRTKEYEKGKTIEIRLDFPAQYSIAADKPVNLKFKVRYDVTREFTVPIRLMD
ncbi:MAG: DUF1573 domain-containing protein [Spirochaetales bacterium]|nr:DUF1573 domain-containing protein [Spirochaetales bacterium]